MVWNTQDKIKQRHSKILKREWSVTGYRGCNLNESCNIVVNKATYILGFINRRVICMSQEGILPHFSEASSGIWYPEANQFIQCPGWDRNYSDHRRPGGRRGKKEESYLLGLFSFELQQPQQHSLRLLLLRDRQQHGLCKRLLLVPHSQCHPWVQGCAFIAKHPGLWRRALFHSPVPQICCWPWGCTCSAPMPRLNLLWQTPGRKKPSSTS